MTRANLLYRNLNFKLHVCRSFRLASITLDRFFTFVVRDTSSIKKVHMLQPYQFLAAGHRPRQLQEPVLLWCEDCQNYLYLCPLFRISLTSLAKHLLSILSLLRITIVQHWYCFTKALVSITYHCLTLGLLSLASLNFSLSIAQDYSAV